MISSKIENIFIDLLFRKAKPISVGIICKPPNQTRILEPVITELGGLDPNDEHYVLGGFDINLLFKGKYILDRPNELGNFIMNF